MEGSQKNKCAAGEHDMTEPLVVNTRTTQDFFWFLMRDTVEKEIAVFYCRKCGATGYAGWVNADDDS